MSYWFIFTVTAWCFCVLRVILYQAISSEVPLFCAAAPNGKRPVYPVRIVAVGLVGSPLVAVVPIARPPMGEVTAHPPDFHVQTGVPTMQLKKKKLPLIYQGQKGANARMLPFMLILRSKVSVTPSPPPFKMFSFFATPLSFV